MKTAYEMRISDWSADVCSSDLGENLFEQRRTRTRHADDEDGLAAKRRVVRRREPRSGGDDRVHARAETSGAPRRLAAQPRVGRLQRGQRPRDRTVVGPGKSVSRRLDLGCRRYLKKQNTYSNYNSVAKNIVTVC